MPASVPEMVRPATVTVLLLSTLLLANVAVADEVDKVTTSPETTPDSAAEPVFNNAVADVVRSYSRLLAVMPVTVMFFAVMFAVAVG